MEDVKLRKQLTELGNELYRVIFPLLTSYETRGFNAHQRTQAIVEQTQHACEHWINIQRERYDMDVRNEHEPK